MKTDRELLELAARAAGQEIWFNPQGECCELGRDLPWNPLLDDGDALRLAVKLGMDVNVWLGGMRTNIIFGGARNPKSVNKDHGANPYAATRRAIVRAAAAIGEGMK